MRMTQLMRDKLVLLKADGTRVLDIKGNVQKGKILIMRGDISIEPGDEIHREMPSGKFEEYVVIEPNFRQGLHGISAHYQTEVRRKEYQPLSAATTSAAHTTNYNFYGANSRVNNASIDYSTNFSGSDENVRLAMDLLKSARKDLESAKMEPADLQTTATTLDIVESQVQAEAPSKPIIKTLLAGLPVVAQALPSIVKLIEMFQS
ncbi:hypothetical protein ACINJM_000002 [Cronobacter sakazakii]|uniref:hypothetical protein n=1 Tax=Cronobacter sakazakii TaxID=28141 RepID=UPI00131A0FB6|nr:hypothetical protein [Cronobacter sakazakii]ELQ6036990.1 hypothetical protein [Cronobacter sakazakii]ELY5776263.1 hypothetical protein [Cronobacter sakazakii]MDQ9185206.1 hypothetical protein [Cronobacter sakazakii]MDT3661177.1 hypothetical protein [Cronobacter sakazakii]